MRSVRSTAKLVVVCGGLWGALAACETDLDPALRDSPNFSMGYNDGCTSGNTRIVGFDKTVRRKDDLYAGDEAYKAGWNEGYISCGGSTTRDTDVFGGEDAWHTSGPLQ